MLKVVPLHSVPIGYNLMKIAVLKALRADKALEGEKILDEVQITSKDFQWLNEIRLLTKCNLANKFGEVEKESRLKEEFLSKQPLLFEPEHVFNFRLVSYQEQLKKEYQSRIKS